jgi:integrase
MQSKPRSTELKANLRPALPGNPNGASPDHRAQFMPVRDSRNRRVRGLYTRNGRFYAQLWVDLGNGKKSARRLPLTNDDDLPVRTLQEAKEALEVKRHQRREEILPALGRKPFFEEYSRLYFDKAKVCRKRPGTIENEKQAVVRWRAHLGHIRIDRITTPVIAAFTDKRLKGAKFGERKLDGASARTVNLDLMVLRNVLNAAIEDGHLRQLPRFKLLEQPPSPKRQLITPSELNRLIDSARTKCRKNGGQLSDYLQFLAYSGAREKEALRIKWQDIELEGEKLVIGADGLSKNGESRTVEFNPQLGGLLREMHQRRPPDCSWLFPSPQRGVRDEHAQSFRESLKLARAAANLPRIGFHDLRHYFCSMCVMAGLDFLTIAAWLGHKDGGILIGKVYGHLLDEHRQQAAKRLSLGLTIMPRFDASGGGETIRV